jgi:hypothetical protein
MNRIHIFCGLFVIAAACQSFAETPQMVERHIFTPENITEQKTDTTPGPIDGSDLLKDIQFTGVMTTNKGKQAIIVESSKKDKDKKKHIVKEGDSIKGMTLKEIGPNYVLLVTKENTVKLSLYKGAKTRPIAPAEPALPEPPAAPPESMNPSKPGSPVAVQQQMPLPGTGKSDVKPNKGPINNQSLPMPVTGSGPGMFGGPNRGSSGPQVPDSGNNPFADAMKKAPENNSPGGNASGPAVSPFVMPAN